MNGLKEMALEAGGREMVSALTHPNGPTTAIKFHVENGSLEAFAKLVEDKARRDLREEIIYTWVPPHFVDIAIESCAEKAWIALVKHKQPWNVRQDVIDAIRARGEA